MLHNIFGRNESSARFLELYQQSILARQVEMESQMGRYGEGGNLVVALCYNYRRVKGTFYIEDFRTYRKVRKIVRVPIYPLHGFNNG